MQFTTIKGEESVSALAARIFGVGPRTAVAKRASAALLEANPALANIKELADGSPIAVPPIEDATPVDKLVALGDLATTAAVAGSRASFERLGRMLDAIADDRERDATERMKAIDAARRLKSRGSQEPAIEFALNRATASAEETVMELKALRQEQRSALAALDADLEELLELLEDA